MNNATIFIGIDLANLREDDLEIYNNQIGTRLPGIKLVKNVDSSIDSEVFLTPNHIKARIELFREDLFDNILNWVLEGKKLKICIPLTGGLQVYYELISKFAGNVSLLDSVDFVFAAKNGTGKDQYSLSAEALEGEYDVFILADDIFDKGGSSGNILSQVPIALKWGEFLATKAGRNHQQFAPIIVYPDEWLTTTCGMDGSLGDPKLYTNPLLQKYAKTIEFWERQCALPIIQESKDLVNLWDESQILDYIKLLKTYAYYEPGSNNNQNYANMILQIQLVKGHEAKLAMAKRIHKQIVQLLQQGRHLHEIVIAHQES